MSLIPPYADGSITDVSHLVNIVLLVLPLQDLLDRAVAQTDGAEVEVLEKLYALLAQCIYRHRQSSDKTQLLQVVLSAHTAAVWLFLLLFCVLFLMPVLICFFACFLTGNAI